MSIGKENETFSQKSAMWPLYFLGRTCLPLPNGSGQTVLFGKGDSEEAPFPRQCTETDRLPVPGEQLDSALDIQ